MTEAFIPVDSGVITLNPMQLRAVKGNLKRLEAGRAFANKIKHHQFYLDVENTSVPATPYS